MSNGNPPVANSKLYFPQLDSIRGLSFIAIFLFHSVSITDKPFFLGDFIRYSYTNLPLGLEVFFVLSSFLLTWLGLTEYQKRGDFSFKNYFRRRALRIWPLYFFILFLGFIIIPAVASYFQHTVSLPDAWYYVFFIANFYTIDHVFFLRILWTISVEEQFYLFWGLSLKFFYKNFKTVITILLLVSISFSVYAIINHVSSYFNTLTYLFDFACGASAAVMAFKKIKIIESLQNLTSFKNKLFYVYPVLHFT
ncbi:MAG TPA: acyltransferase, partial [Hanamia sp.]|nr:acyltransferase [Hanamia sp.]